MPTLSSSIVERSIASVRDVEEALAHQSLHGGDLVTNLLELASPNEAALTRAIAESMELEPAPAGELVHAPDDVRRLVPGDLARRYGFYPLERAGNRLVVAVSEPLPSEVVSDLEFSLGLELDQRATTQVRVQQAVARDYGVALDRRSARLLAKLAGLPDPNPSELPPGVEKAEPVESGSSATLPSMPAARPEPAEARSVPPSAPPPSDPPAATGAPAPGGRRRLGPYTPAMAERDLLRAKSRDHVLRAFFDFAAQYFEYAALFVVHGDLAEGRDAHGSGASRAKVLGIGVPLDLPSSLASVVAREPYRLARLSASGLDSSLLKDLERPPGPLSLLLPVRVRSRTVLVLYGDHGDTDVELGAVGEVLAFIPLVAAALERVILRRKRLGLGASPEEAPELTPTGESQPIPVARTVSVEPPRWLTPDPPLSFAPSRVLAVGANTEADALFTPDPAPSLPTRPTPETPAVATTPVPEGPLRGIVAIPGTIRTPIPTSFGPNPTPALPRNPPPPGLPTAELPPWRRPVAPEIGERAEPPRTPTQAQGLAPVPSPAPAGAESVERSAEGGRREHTVEQLVRRLSDGDTTAGDRLVQIGEGSVAALLAVFPGPLTAPLRRGGADGLARASTCGPVLKTLARLGPLAAAALAARARDTDSALRAWATRLLGEVASADAARAVTERFLDEDTEVRRAALDAGRMLKSQRAAGAALANALSAMLQDAELSEASRHVLIEAVADLRESSVVPGLAALLAAESAEIRRAAHWALVVLTRDDRGESAPGWEQWWLVNAGRHRVEWLIDALMHDSQEMRRTAGDELKSLTKEYFGYYDDLSPRERERAQQRYREWWESKGRAQFGAA